MLLYVILVYIFHDVGWDVFFDVLRHLVTYSCLPVIKGGSSFSLPFIILLVSMLQFVTASWLLNKNYRLWWSCHIWSASSKCLYV